MILPIPVDLTKEELDQQYNIVVEELNHSMEVGVGTDIIVAPIPSDIYERLDAIESQEPYWNAKYDENNQPPYPVKSVDSRLGHVTLGDLYDTESISYEDIRSIFS